MSAQEQHKRLKPLTYQRVIDVLEQAQIDVSRWGDFKGVNPATNPLIYQWSFEQPGERVALFLWWTNIKIDGDLLTYRFAPRKPTGLSPASEAKWKASSNRFLRHVQAAYGPSAAPEIDR